MPEILRKHAILNYLCKWSNKKKIKIFDYSLRKEEKAIPGYKMNKVDWVYYLDVWYQ